MLLTMANFCFSQTDVSFELIQPASSPAIDLDLVKGSKLGGNQIYDMDGDGDNDFLFYAASAGFPDYHFIAYINDGENHYRRIEMEAEPGISGLATEPIVRFADLNRDGINDLVIGGEKALANSNDAGATRVFFGDSEGQLHYQSQLVLQSTHSGDFRLVDFNGDTHPDIFLISSLYGTSLLLNDGAGNFSEAEKTGFTDKLTLRLAVSKFYDGGVDVIVHIYDGGLTNVIYRYEEGTFTEVIRDFRTINSPYHALEFGDANGDGYPDLFILDVDQTLLYLNDQSGNYVLDTSNDFDDLSAYHNYSLHFEELNNDGADEIAFAISEDELAIFWNDSEGNYGEHDSYVITDFRRVPFGDVSGDGYPDIVNYGTRDISDPSITSDETIPLIFINDQANGFDSAAFNITPEFRDGDIAFFDANEDGAPDMLVSGAYYVGTESITELYLNDGAGEFTLTSGLPFEGLEYASMATSDFNGDEHEDVVLSGLEQNDEAKTTIYLGDGAGGFAEDFSNSLRGILGESIAFDANGDQYPDVLIIGRDISDVLFAELYLNDGFGTMTLHVAGLTGLDSVSVATGDVDADQDIDLLIKGVDASDMNQTLLYLNDGLGNFTEATDTGLASLADGRALMFDVDGDKDLDIYLSGGGQFLVYKNDGFGNFTGAQSDEGAFRTAAIAGDIDLDGDLDLIESGKWANDYEDGGVPRTFVYFNDGSGNFTKASVGALHGIFDSALALADIDGDLDLDFMLSGPVEDYLDNSSRLYRNTSCGSTATVNQEVSSCTAYNFYGTILNTTGNYQNIIYSIDGCARTVNLDFIFTGDSETISASACDSYEFDGQTITTSGLYQAVYTNQYACDSLVTLNLAILTDEVEVDIDACDSYELDGATYSISGQYFGFFTNQHGCDSVVTVNLTILERTEGSEDVEMCNSYDWEGTNYSVSGIYQETLINAAGCDSTATLNLTILEEPVAQIQLDEDFILAESVEDATYQWYDCDTETALEGENQLTLSPPAAGSFYVAVDNGSCASVSECIDFEDVVMSISQDFISPSAYPNPTSSHIKLDLEQEYETIEVEVMTIAGHLVNHIIKSNTNEIVIDLGDKKGESTYRRIGY